MCGIAGIVARNPDSRWPYLVNQMLVSLSHRGPDDGGIIVLPSWNSEKLFSRKAGDFSKDIEQGVLVLGNRRLAILDLSAAGHQPMATDDERVWVTYNGEIYNYIELRSELIAAGYHFSSDTDTEVVLKSYSFWGTDCFRRFNGMWALALWDHNKRQLILARDHFGIKPLYYYLQEDCLFFVSEIRALLLDNNFQKKPNLRAIYEYLAEKTVDTNEDTFFQGVKRVPAASYLIFDVSDPSRTLSARSETFWELRPRAMNSKPFFESAEQLQWLLEDSIRLRLRSDVAAGVCLSGGLDSSGIVALLQKLLSGGKVNAKITGPSVKTFSICYPSERFDEKPYIDALIQDSQAESYFTFPTGEEIGDEISRIVQCQEEPFGSTGIASQWFVFRLAHNHGVKVMLDGQGADELFGGYLTFFYPHFKDYFKRKDYGKLLIEILAFVWRHNYWRFWRVEQFATVLARFNKNNTHNPKKESSWLSPERPDWLQRGAFPPEIKSGAPLGRDLPETGGALKNACASYLLRYSLPSLLRFEDKNSMYFSIESRLPYLDPRLVEFAFSLPAEYCLHLGTTKRILRRALQEVLPPKILRRRVKLGFATPEAAWFRGPLRRMLDELFESRSFAERNLFNVPVARHEWKKFLMGLPADPSRFWRWANLELWFRQFID